MLGAGVLVQLQLQVVAVRETPDSDRSFKLSSAVSARSLAACATSIQEDGETAFRPVWLTGFYWTRIE
jgi:hypothetical protein